MYQQEDVHILTILSLSGRQQHAIQVKMSFGVKMYLNLYSRLP